MTIPANLYHMQFALHSNSGLSLDDVVTTCFFMKGNADSPALSEAEAQDVTDAWLTMIVNSLSNTLSGTATAKWYHWSDPKPRVPIATLTPAGVPFARAADTLPREVALCLSWRGAHSSGTPANRTRGRIYLGPFGTANADSTTGRPLAAAITAYADKVGTFFTTVAAINETDIIRPVVWSNGVGGRKPDGTYRPNWTNFASEITEVVIDNEWDTQRRRQLKATARTVVEV